MNALARREPAPAPVSTQPSVAEILNRFLEPARSFHAHRAMLADKRQLPSLDNPQRYLTCEQRHRAGEINRTRQVMALWPSLDGMKTLRAEMHEAATVQVEEPVARLLIGVLFDSFRAPPGDGAGVMVSSLLGLLFDPIDDFDEETTRSHCISAAALAWAVRQLIRTSKFPPSIAEVVDACRKAEGRFRGAAWIIGRQIEWRCEAEAYVAAIERLPPYIEQAPTPAPALRNSCGMEWA